MLKTTNIVGKRAREMHSTMTALSLVKFVQHERGGAGAVDRIWILGGGDEFGCGIFWQLLHPALRDGPPPADSSDHPFVIGIIS